VASGKRKKRTKIAWRALVHGAVCGVAVLIVSVLLLTLFVYLGWMQESAIGIGNTVIKILSALVAGAVTVRGRNAGNWILGGIAALAGLAFSTVIMSIYLGSFSFSWKLAADFLMSFAIGAAAAAVFSRRGKE